MKKSLFLMLAGILLFLLSCSKEEVRPLLNPQTELGILVFIVLIMNCNGTEKH